MIGETLQALHGALNESAEWLSLEILGLPTVKPGRETGPHTYDNGLLGGYNAPREWTGSTADRRRVYAFDSTGVAILTHRRMRKHRTEMRQCRLVFVNGVVAEVATPWTEWQPARTGRFLPLTQRAEEVDLLNRNGVACYLDNGFFAPAGGRVVMGRATH